MLRLRSQGRTFRLGRASTPRITKANPSTRAVHWAMTGCIHGRIWKNHLKTGNDLSRSSFRRNVCEHLGLAPTSKTTIRPTLMTAADVEPVNQWIQSARWPGSSVRLPPRQRRLKGHYTVSGCRPSPDGDTRLVCRAVTRSPRSGGRDRGNPDPGDVLVHRGRCAMGSDRRIGPGGCTISARAARWSRSPMSVAPASC